MNLGVGAMTHLKYRPWKYIVPEESRLRRKVFCGCELRQNLQSEGVPLRNGQVDFRGVANSLNLAFHGMVPATVPGGGRGGQGTAREFNRVSSATSPAEPYATALSSNGALIRRMLALSWPYRWGCLRLLALQGILLWTALAALDLSGVGIDVVLYHAKVAKRPAAYPLGFTPPANWPPLAEVGLIAGAILLLAVCRGCLNYLYAVESGKLIHERIVVDLRARVYDKLQRLSFRFFDANSTGAIINRVTSDVQSVRAFVDGVIIQLVILVLSLACYLVYMLRIDAGVTLACLATTPLLWLVTVIFSRLVRPAYDRTRELVDRVVLTLAENIQGVHVVKGFGREREEIAKFGSSLQAVEDQQQQIFWKVSLFTPAIGFLTQFNVVVLLAYGGWLVTQDRLALGTGLVVLVGLLTQFASQVANLTNITNSVQQSLSGARRVFEVLDTPVEIRRLSRPVALPRARGAVAFENVSFAFDAALPVLQDVSFAVEPGQCVAILGATGAGKSTVLSLIARFYDATAGRVLIDGHDVRTLDVDDLRRNIGIVFQESFLFGNTIAANIAYGQPHATRAQIERAARIACAHEFIFAAPEGYDAVLGEGGMNLSGGQRQRLAIARALLLDPAILLLDDPAAAIDPHTEHKILAAMQQAMEGRTTFVVAHRLSTLRHADLVLVLEEGRIVQTGTHEELLELPGHYQTAAAIQGVGNHAAEDGSRAARDGSLMFQSRESRRQVSGGRE
jgi:ATP-binding cassette subfamily B protein